eukprot:6062623-Amphidinium_carterae.1
MYLQAEVGLFARDVHRARTDGIMTMVVETLCGDTPRLINRKLSKTTGAIHTEKENNTSSKSSS